MIDESFDTEFLGKPPEPWEFRSKPIWQRMIVISAGVIMNLLLAVLIFWAINYIQGSAVRETTTIGYVIEQSAAARAGLQSGDRVLEINGNPVQNWDQLLSDLYIETMGNDVALTVQRGRSTAPGVRSPQLHPGAERGAIRHRPGPDPDRCQ